MSAERAWAYGMQLKHEGQTERRKHLHMIERLRKAVTYANTLTVITEQSPSCRPRTKQEAKAYAAGMNGILKFEQASWEEAKDYLMEAQTIYVELSASSRKEHILRAVYDKKVEELRPLVTFSAYNIGDESAMEDLRNMQGQGTDIAEIDNLIAATRQKEAASVSEFPVTWRDRTVLVTHDKVRMFLMSLRDHDSDVTKAATNQAKIAITETLLFNCKDAMQVLRDELKTDPSFSMRTGSESISDIHYLYTYLSYIRLQNTITRNMFMIDNTTDSNNQSFESKTSGRALQDSIRLYEINLQNFTEIQQLPTVGDDVDLITTIKHQVTAQKALRCFAIAESFGQSKKPAEALVLYDRSKEYVAAVISALQDTDMQARLLKLQRNIDSRMLIMQAQNILSQDDHAIKTADKATLKKRLTERLDEFVEDSSVLTKQPNIAVFPPEFTPVPCKPLFFDLALNHVEMPNLDSKLDVKPAPAAAGGLTGLVKGLWGGWGSK